jgi:hypothetical protein
MSIVGLPCGRAETLGWVVKPLQATARKISIRETGPLLVAEHVRVQTHRSCTDWILTNPRYEKSCTALPFRGKHSICSHVGQIGAADS